MEEEAKEKSVNVDLKGMTTTIMPLVQKYTQMLEQINEELKWQRQAIIKLHEAIEELKKMQNPIWN